MPLLLIFIGLLLVITGFQDSYKALGSQVQKDFTGQDNFFYWLLALAALGALGYFNKLKTFSDVIMGLIILVMIVSKNQGVTFFENLIPSLQQGSTTPAAPIGTPVQGAVGGSAGSGGANSAASSFGSAFLSSAIDAGISSFG